MNIRMLPVAGVIGALGMALIGQTVLAPQAVAASVTLQPHQAHYRLETTEVRMPGAGASLPGEFIVRLQKRCNGWVLLTQLTLGLEVSNGRILEIESIGAAEESLDGRAMSFESKLRMNNELIESLKGTAALNADGTGVVNITVPEAQTLPLPKGTIFSVSAFHDTVGKILAGEKIVNYILFDGSTPEPIRGTDVVVGPAKPMDEPPEGDADLIEGPGWQVVTSFYGLNDTDAHPLVTNTAHVFANGITTRISLDIGLAVTDGTLTLLQALPEPSCP